MPNQRVREILVEAIDAGSFGIPLPPAIATAVNSGSRALRIEELALDSLGWMEFCISVELQSGQELTPADIETMRFVFEIEEWLETRLK